MNELSFPPWSNSDINIISAYSACSASSAICFSSPVLGTFLSEPPRSPLHPSLRVSSPPNPSHRCLELLPCLMNPNT